VVPRNRHDELLEALAGTFSQVRVDDPFDAQTQMGPLVASRQRDRVEGYIARGIADGATLATGGGRPKHLERGWFVEPTVFGNVDNSVGHNAFRTDFSVSFGGFKQSGIGREGVHEGLPHFLETKFVVLEGRPAGYEDTVL
jgi:acyl-CoA reductase-like NAD-dependent aldehyde dehydrogenase